MGFMGRSATTRKGWFWPWAQHVIFSPSWHVPGFRFSALGRSMLLPGFAYLSLCSLAVVDALEIITALYRCRLYSNWFSANKNLSKFLFQLFGVVSCLLVQLSMSTGASTWCWWMNALAFRLVLRGFTGISSSFKVLKDAELPHFCSVCFGLL